MKQKTSPIIKAKELLELSQTEHIILIDVSVGKDAQANYAAQHPKVPGLSAPHEAQDDKKPEIHDRAPQNDLSNAYGRHEDTVPIDAHYLLLLSKLVTGSARIMISLWDNSFSRRVLSSSQYLRLGPRS